MTPAARSGRVPGSRRSPACWTWRTGRRDAGHRPQGTPPPRRAAAVHRHRRPPVHLLRHQHQARAARRPGTTPPAPGPVRGPDPLRQGHRPAQPAPAGLRAEPGLVRDRRAGLRTARLDADARPHRRSPPLGTQTAAAALFTCAGRIVRGGRRLKLRLAASWPWAGQITTAIAACRPSHPADQPKTIPTTRKDTPAGPWNPAHPARQPGHQR